jgi:hypothetical protein
MGGGGMAGASGSGSPASAVVTQQQEEEDDGTAEEDAAQLTAEMTQVSDEAVDGDSQLYADTSAAKAEQQHQHQQSAGSDGAGDDAGNASVEYSGRPLYSDASLDLDTSLSLGGRAGAEAGAAAGTDADGFAGNDNDTSLADVSLGSHDLSYLAGPHRQPDLQLTPVPASTNTNTCSGGMDMTPTRGGSSQSLSLTPASCTHTELSQSTLSISPLVCDRSDARNGDGDDFPFNQA